MWLDCTDNRFQSTLFCTLFELFFLKKTWFFYSIWWICEFRQKQSKNRLFSSRTVLRSMNFNWNQIHFNASENSLSWEKKRIFVHIKSAIVDESQIERMWNQTQKCVLLWLKLHWPQSCSLIKWHRKICAC